MKGARSRLRSLVWCIIFVLEGILECVSQTGGVCWIARHKSTQSALGVTKLCGSWVVRNVIGSLGQAA